jgi:hypothetical protein
MGQPSAWGASVIFVPNSVIGGNAKNVDSWRSPRDRCYRFILSSKYYLRAVSHLVSVTVRGIAH